MKNTSFGGYGSSDAYVKAKLERFDSMDKSFTSLFELMFSEAENVMYEQSRGYKILKTTYKEAYDDIKLRIPTLKSLLSDVSPDSVIGLYMTNSLDWLIIFWTIIACGFRPLLMNLMLDKRTLQTALDDIGAAAVISDGETFDTKTIPSWQIKPSGSPAEPEVFGTELFVMSSGTSSHIKLCAYTAERLYFQIRDSYVIITSCRQMKKHYHGQLKLLTFLPFYHIFGLTAVYIWFAFFSRTFVQLNDMQPQTVVNTIRRHNVTHIFAVPLFWNRVYEQAISTIRQRGEKTYKKFTKALRFQTAISGMRVLSALFARAAFAEVRSNLFGESVCFMITGGSEIRGEVLEFFNCIGYRLADGYGASEIGITSVELSGNKKILNGCSVGKPLASVRYDISADGELLVKGSAVAVYILQDGQKTYMDGWFHTRDAAVCRGGRYYILGRMDDLLTAPSGENLNPGLIEPMFDLPGVAGVCLIGADEDGRRVPVLIVSVGGHITKEALSELDGSVKARAFERKLSSQIEKIVYISDGLIGENEFKLNRARIAKAYADKTLTPAVPQSGKTAEWNEGDETLDRVRTYFAAALGKADSEITSDTDFFLDGGGTSLDYFALISRLQEEFSIAFPTSGGKGLNTVKGICDYIRASGRY